MNYEHLNEASRILNKEHVSAPASQPLLVATSLTSYIRTSDSQLSLGPGPFAKALEAASTVQAVSVGKPGKEFFEGCVRSMGAGAGASQDGRIAIVGDDVVNDLGGGAIELGFWRVLGTVFTSFIQVLSPTTAGCLFLHLTILFFRSLFPRV
jgi:ribonucleotide monophosphatase NagD (HAD superfamily)